MRAWRGWHLSQPWRRPASGRVSLRPSGCGPRPRAMPPGSFSPDGDACGGGALLSAPWRCSCWRACGARHFSSTSGGRRPPVGPAGRPRSGGQRARRAQRAFDCGVPDLEALPGPLAAYRLGVPKHVVEPDRQPQTPGVVFRSRLTPRTRRRGQSPPAFERSPTLASGGCAPLAEGGRRHNQRLSQASAAATAGLT